MLGVYLGNYHRNVGSSSVSGVVGNNGAFSLCIALFKCLYLVLFHIHCAENEVYLRCDLFDIGSCVHNDHISELFGDRLLHCPLCAYCVLIALACASGRRCQHLYIEPRVFCQEEGKTLSHHTRCSDNTNIILLHLKYSFII